MLYHAGMEDTSVTHLHLHAPLWYAQAAGLFPENGSSAGNEAAREKIFCFELNGEQAQRIDPDSAALLGKLIFAGNGDGTQENAGQQASVQIPAGGYLFSQQRQALDMGQCIDFAVEQQKDGLWERFAMKNILYIRQLFEDGSMVTQLLRPLA